MDIKQKILHLYRVNEKSLREISRELGIDRKTVTRLVNAYEAASHEIDTLIAGMFGFEKCPYSEAEKGSSIAPEVKI